MNKIILSPWSKSFESGKENPKNYPYWKELVQLLHQEGFYLIQVGTKGEPMIDQVDEFVIDKHFRELEPLIQECTTWISVDNFFPHFCNCINSSRWGIVLWSKSDPNLFGYKQNINLLKNKKYLRSNQFDVWFNEQYSQEAFVRPQMVMSTLRQKIQIRT
jgi:hypothetical protein